MSQIGLTSSWFLLSFSKTLHWMVLLIRCGLKLFCRHQNVKFDLSTRVDFWWSYTYSVIQQIIRFTTWKLQNNLWFYLSWSLVSNGNVVWICSVYIPNQFTGYKVVNPIKEPVLEIVRALLNLDGVIPCYMQSDHPNQLGTLQCS